MQRNHRLRRPGAIFLAAGLAGLVLAAAPAAALPLISEVFYDAVGADDGLLFVELSGEPGFVLDGLTLEGVNGSNGAVGPVITLSGAIGADGLFVVADTDSQGATAVPDADQLANFDFQNGPDSVELHDGASVLDAVGYGDFDPAEIFAGEGTPAPDAPPGSSLARIFADVDTDDNVLDFEVLAMPTPGAAAFVVPEPGTATLMFTGLTSLWVLGRSKRRTQRRAH